MVGRALGCRAVGRSLVPRLGERWPSAWLSVGEWLVEFCGVGARHCAPTPQHYSCAMSCSCSCGASFVIPIPVAPHSIAKKIAIQFEMAHGKYDRVATPRVPAM